MTDWYIPAFRPIFPSGIWTGPSPHVYLTFDDGPHPVATPRVLEILSKHQLQATFFLTGSNVDTHPALAESVRASGHAIGNHGFSHRSYLSQSWSDVERDVRAGLDSIERVTGERPGLFRPPYGRMWPSMPARFRGLGLRTVLWSVNAWDYDAGVSSEKIVGMVVRRVEPGDIVLLHDNARTAERGNSYLDGMISGIRDRGLPFGCLR